MPQQLGIHSSDQDLLGFMIEQRAHIEPEVIRTSYEDIIYPQLIPVDTSAYEWTDSILFFSADQSGQAEWHSEQATSSPVVNETTAMHRRDIHMASIGYRHSLDEIARASQLGINLNSDRMVMARRAYEEFVQKVAFFGDDKKGFKGLLNHSDVTAADAVNGANGSALWSNKTAEEILTDVNTILRGGFEATKGRGIANTLLLPIEAFSQMVDKRVPDTDMMAMRYVMENNLYTAMTGQPLAIRAINDLSDAASSNRGRAVAYRNDRSVLKLDIPMPHRFLETRRVGPMEFVTDGIFRLGGVMIYDLANFRYLDGISS